MEKDGKKKMIDALLFILLGFCIGVISGIALVYAVYKICVDDDEKDV